MTKTQGIPEWREKRNAALTSLDMAWARQAMPDASSDEIRLLAMHKARYECVDIAPELRHASAECLLARSSARWNGDPLLPIGVLPE